MYAFKIICILFLGHKPEHCFESVGYARALHYIDVFLYNILGLLQDQYQKLDSGVLSRTPEYYSA